MDRGARVTGVKRIRIHDIRHSHVSLLIEMGFSAVAIADRAPVSNKAIEPPVMTMWSEGNAAALRSI